MIAAQKMKRQTHHVLAQGLNALIQDGTSRSKWLHPLEERTRPLEAS